jgi:hypothetical protein
MFMVCDRKKDKGGGKVFNFAVAKKHLSHNHESRMHT